MSEQLDNLENRVHGLLAEAIDRLDEYKAENEKLRAALKTIRPAEPGGTSNGLLRGDWQMIKEVQGE